MYGFCGLFVMLTIVGGYTIYKLTFVLIRFLSEGVLYVSGKGRHGRRQLPQREAVDREMIVPKALHEAVHEELFRLMSHPLLICLPSAFLWREHYHESTRRVLQWNEVLMTNKQVVKREV